MTMIKGGRGIRVTAEKRESFNKKMTGKKAKKRGSRKV